MFIKIKCIKFYKVVLYKLVFNTYWYNYIVLTNRGKTLIILACLPWLNKYGNGYAKFSQFDLEEHLVKEYQ